MRQRTILLSAIAMVAVAVLSLLYIQVIRPILNDRTVATVVPMTITGTGLPLEFTYPSGEEGYTLIEPPVATTSPEGVLKVYLIMENQAYLDFQVADSPQEAPPTVSIFVLQEKDSVDGEKVGYISRLQTWANAHPKYSSFPLIKSEPEVVEIDGVPALRYRTDGLYQQEVYLASRKGKIVVFTGQFNEETDDIYIMYTELIRSVIFN